MMSKNEYTTSTMNFLEHATVDGNARLQVGNNYTEVHNYNGPGYSRCLADLRLTDPRDDKLRIEQTKGGLLRDSYKWILEHEVFRRWQDDQDSRLLWIKGDAGKGKTMLLCGILNELSLSRVQIPNTSQGSSLGDAKRKTSHRCHKLSPTFAPSKLVSFFFCQSTDSRLNQAAHVLRGLIYILICQQPTLISHIQDRYDHAGRRLFDDKNTFYILSQVLTSMLHDLHAKSCYLVVDALDECDTGLPQLLDFIVQSLFVSPHIKWIISSRSKYEIEQQLYRAASKTRVSLELNSHHVTQAINTYIDHRIAQLLSLKDNELLQKQVRSEMRQKADGTFLWVAHVAQELRHVQSWNILRVLKQMPAGLLPLYRRMMLQIQQLGPHDIELCRLIVSTVSMAYRPLHLCELGVVSGLPRHISSDRECVEKLADMCGSFLTVRDDHVYLIHQSVKDFLISEACTAIFQSGFTAAHHTMFLQSICIMSETLYRDMYGLRHPGSSADDLHQPKPDPLAAARYSCVYWVDHLRDSVSPKTSSLIDKLNDCKTIHQFISKKYLHWLEALSLLHSMPEGVMAMQKLGAWVVSPRNFIPESRLMFHPGKYWNATGGKAASRRTPIHSFPQTSDRDCPITSLRVSTNI